MSAFGRIIYAAFLFKMIEKLQLKNCRLARRHSR